MRGNGWVLLPLVAFAASGCAMALEADDSADEARSEFEEAFGDLDGEFGDGKADLFGWLPDPCELLAPLLSFGDDFMHSGLVLGIEGEGLLGATVGFGGYDLVVDLYHQQLTVSQYRGAGIGVPGAGASVQVYVGAAVGFEHGVSDWDGWFVTTTAEIGLPFLDDFVSLDPAVFVSAVDDNGDNFIAPNEVLPPPSGVYGFTLGVSAGFDLVPDPLPIEGSITEGYWHPYKEAVRYYYDQLRAKRILGISRLNVRLVDHHDGSECSDDWPHDGSGRDCVVEFGDPDDSWVRRSVDMAYGICHITGGCELPLTWPMSASGIAVGALRSSGLSFSEFCPDQNGPEHH